MNNQPNIPFEDPVDKAVATFRGMETPAGPTETLVKLTANRMNAGSGGAGVIGAGSQRKGWWTMKMVRRSAIAAGLVLAAGAAALLTPWSGGTRVALADVIEQVKQAQAVKCTVTGKVQIQNREVRADTMEMLMVDPGISITTAPGMKLMMDAKKGKMIVLSPEQKLATVIDITKSPAQAKQAVPNVLEYFKRMTPEGSKPLGEKEIENVKARGFRADKDGAKMEVWADEKTEKPVLVVMTIKSGGFLPAGTFTFSDFDWNPTVDPDDVAMKIPADYRVSNTAMDLSNVGDADITKMLQSLAGYNDGVLPESIDQSGALKVVLPHFAKNKTVVQGDREAMQKMQQEIMEALMPVSRAWSFMMDSTKGTDWAYAGAGVRTSEKGYPVLWYKPAGATGKWRVFDADGVIHDVGAAPEGGTPLKMTIPGGLPSAPVGGTEVK
jgi:hypothetical protein